MYIDSPLYAFSARLVVFLHRELARSQYIWRASKEALVGTPPLRSTKPRILYFKREG